MLIFDSFHCLRVANLASRVKSFPDVKLGINIPTRGESSDLLNADGDKNDYEWLVVSLSMTCI